MTIQEFVEKAVEGGWGGGLRADVVIEMLPNKMIGFSYPGSFDGVSMSIYDILLQPKAWQAVGKMVWGEGALQMHSKYGFRPYVYEHQMHCMMDALNNGSTIEGFLKTL